MSYWKLRGALWHQIQAFYAAIVVGVENPKITWRTSFSEYESFIIDKPNISQMGKPDKNMIGSEKKDKDTWFCQEFNTPDGCSLTAPHMVTDVQGREKSALHICSKYWQKTKQRLSHSAISQDCPNRAA